jgi:hypothetical protein
VIAGLVMNGASTIACGKEATATKPPIALTVLALA